jgi:Peptidase family M48
MDAWLGTVDLPGLWMGITLVASLFSAWLYPDFRQVIAGCRPATRARVVFWYGLIAPVAAGTVLLLLMQPEMSALLVPPHCHGGDCRAHVPVFSAGSVGGMIFVAAGSLALFGALLGCIYGLRLGRRWLRTLFAFSRQRAEAGYRIVESPALLAWCYGLWRPEVFVSRGMIQRLSPRQLETVLAHEQAHAARRDNLRAFALSRATLLWPGALKRRIRADLCGAAEEACDAHAARRVGDPSFVASVIEALQPAGERLSAGHTAGFGSSAAEERIAALVGPVHTYSHAGIAWLMLAALWLLQVAIATGLSHYLVEWVAAIGA